MDANELRSAFTRFFAARGHEVVPSASLIPHHPRAPLFTNAGMNQFIPYFLGEEIPPYPRATSVQKCVRIRGKHDDIELIGRTTRHLTFFEMLGNFSFGDYFKTEAITWAWEFLTERTGSRRRSAVGDRAHERRRGVPPSGATRWGCADSRIQRLGEDNFWEMGETGPCGPSSEIYYDRGPAWGDDGGPAAGGEERFVEMWNLVFTQYDRQADGTLTAAAQAEHRHRGGPRADPHDPPGHPVGLGDRRAAPDDRTGRGAHRAPLRRRRRDRRGPAGPGRPRTVRHHAHRRRRRCPPTRAGATCCAG